MRPTDLVQREEFKVALGRLCVNSIHCVDRAMASLSFIDFSILKSKEKLLRVLSEECWAQLYLIFASSFEKLLVFQSLALHFCLLATSLLK